MWIDTGAFNIRERFRSFKRDWLLKTPKEKWQFLYNIPKIMFETVGVRVFSDLKLNLYSQLGNLLVAYYGSLSIYTLYYYYDKNQLVHGLRCLCGYGIFISVSTIDNSHKILHNIPIICIHLLRI